MGLTFGFQMHCGQLIIPFIYQSRARYFSYGKVGVCRGVPMRVPASARAGLRGTPHFCCKSKEGGT